ncbi:type II restriction enzyme NspV-like protein [Crinalium epipsammum PCC 9333]|uniref:Type II restriction enzyme NspV-like protein n=1 Tax=Crinalium epipsammum PCC 9333 TaxID=1173022 RepID=K9W200_9CYAN|nr:type II restriction enzyme NspV-like protein [Crinalium epipsammum]AFZ13777.1 type II restriction enzyme NspV-like protein [Crinalium epipsammum PCC 9333]
MIHAVQRTKIEYGDFQTPSELAEKICSKLVQLGVIPDVIIEPTCGVGNFIDAAAHFFPSVDKIIGIEINSNYLQKIKTKDLFIKSTRIEIKNADFFQFNWISLINQLSGKILILGNFPWVTNSQQGTIGGGNLPEKNNFQNHSGLDAITGKSNFDISEWMLIQAIHWLQNRDGYLAMLCKTSVSRKILSYIHSKKLNLVYCATYKIDTKKYFNANVEACLLFCKFDLGSQNYFCDLFSSLEDSDYQRIGYRDNVLVRDVASFDKLRKLSAKSIQAKWRSGIKHDCSKVMELRKIDNVLVNGFGESVEIEDTYLFPLIKGSDVAQNRIKTTEKFVIVPQRFVGEETDNIKNLAPKTWQYLESHARYLDVRKSKIYQNNPRFSIFGVGSYTFAAWKIAICGLYKKLDFKLIGEINNKPVIFDDTVYILSFDNEQAAYETFKLLTSPLAISFYSSLIFWDEKRPIKSSILNSLNLATLAEDLINSKTVSSIS